MKTVKHDNGESDRHDRRYMYIPSFALPIYKTTCHTKPYLCCCCCCCCCWWWCCYCTMYCWLVLLGVFFFSSNLLRKLHGDGCCCTAPSEKFRVRPRYDYEKKICESWLQNVLLLLSFLLWCSDDRRKNTRTGTPWCIADWLLQVLRSRLITTNY